MICPACGTENIDGIDRCENCLAPFRDLDVPRADTAEGLARSVMEDKLSRLEFDEPVCVAPQTPALEVARLMKNAHSGCALVLDEGKLVGIFTEHDVLLRMTRLPKASNAVAQIDGAPFENEPIIITDTVPEIPFGDIPVEEIRAEEMELSEAGTHRPREDAQVSDDDLLVGDLMSRDPETLNENDSVASALNKMSLGRYRHIPIKRNDRSYAVASIKSVLKYIAQEDW